MDHAVVGFDIGDDEQEQSTAPSGGASAIASALKRTGAAPTSPDEVRDDPEDGSPAKKIRAETDSAKLRDFLNNLGN